MEGKTKAKCSVCGEDLLLNWSGVTPTYCHIDASRIYGHTPKAVPKQATR